MVFDETYLACYPSFNDIFPTDVVKKNQADKSFELKKSLLVVVEKIFVKM